MGACYKGAGEVDARGCVCPSLGPWSSAVRPAGRPRKSRVQVCEAGMAVVKMVSPGSPSQLAVV